MQPYWYQGSKIKIDPAAFFTDLDRLHDSLYHKKEKNEVFQKIYEPLLDFFELLHQEEIPEREYFLGLLAQITQILDQLPKTKSGSENLESFFKNYNATKNSAEQLKKTCSDYFDAAEHNIPKQGTPLTKTEIARRAHQKAANQYKIDKLTLPFSPRNPAQKLKHAISHNPIKSSLFFFLCCLGGSTCIPEAGASPAQGALSIGLLATLGYAIDHRRRLREKILTLPANQPATSSIDHLTLTWADAAYKEGINDKALDLFEKVNQLCDALHYKLKYNELFRGTIQLALSGIQEKLCRALPPSLEQVATLITGLKVSIYSLLEKKRGGKLTGEFSFNVEEVILAANSFKNAIAAFHSNNAALINRIEKLEKNNPRQQDDFETEAYADYQKRLDALITPLLEAKQQESFATEAHQINPLKTEDIMPILSEVIQRTERQPDAPTLLDSSWLEFLTYTLVFSSIGLFYQHPQLEIGEYSMLSVSTLFLMIQTYMVAKNYSAHRSETSEDKRFQSLLLAAHQQQANAIESTSESLTEFDSFIR